MAQARFSIREAVAEGFAFWRTHWLKAIGSLTLLATVVLVTSFQSGTPAGAVVSILLVSIAQLPAMGAFYRIALEGEGGDPASGNGPLGLQWKGLETRLLGVFGLTFLLSVIIVMVVLFVAAAITAGLVAGDPDAVGSPEALMAGLGQGGRMALNLIALAVLFGLVVLAARLSMATPATVAQRRIRFLSSLTMTRGMAVPIFATLFVINAPILLIQFLGSSLLGRQDPVMAIAVNAVVAAIGVYFYIPILVGAMSHIYRKLSAEGVA